MTPERHLRMQEIFEAAIDLPLAARKAFLEEACGADVDLQERVLDLLEAAESTDSITMPELARGAAAATVQACPLCGHCYDEAVLVCPRDQQRLDFALPGPLLIDGKYRMERLIGRGGMGAVYLVTHIHLHKKFALKIIATEGVIPESYRNNFENEAHALGRLSHPNIVSVTDYGVDPRGGGLPYLVMEYLEGETVRQFAERRDNLPFSEAVPLLRDIATAVDTAHAQRIVHGDLKPSNLFLAKEVARERVVKVVDFGLARLAPPGGEESPSTDSAPRKASSVHGTPAYMAPELFEGQPASPASDRFALGALIYEILTGTLPFGRRPWGVRENQRQPLTAPSECNREIPVELDAPLLALLNTAVELRPASCATAISAMEAAWLLANQRKWRAREVPRRFVYAAIAAAAAILIAALAAQAPIVQMVEERVEDARFATIPSRPPDPRVLVVAFDDAALKEADPQPLTEWHDSFGRGIEQMFAGGARAVALDLSLTDSWRESHEFSQAIQRHADRLALAELSTPSGEVQGPECVNPLTAYAIGPDRLIAMFGFANLDYDADGRVRHSRIIYLDRAGKKRLSFAARAIQAALLEPGALSSFDRPVWIDYSVRPDSLARISWKDVGQKNSPDLFRDRLVIIGVDSAGLADKHRVPRSVSRGSVSGFEIQALIANTIAMGFPVRSPGLFMCMLVISVICFGTIAAALRYPHHPVAAVLTACGSACGYAALTFLIFRLSRTMLAVAGPELAILVSAGTAWYLRSRLSPYPVAGAEGG